MLQPTNAAAAPSPGGADDSAVPRRSGSMHSTRSAAQHTSHTRRGSMNPDGDDFYSVASSPGLSASLSPSLSPGPMRDSPAGLSPSGVGMGGANPWGSSSDGAKPVASGTAPQYRSKTVS